MTKQKLWTLPIFIAAVAATSYFGAQFTPGEWYEGLQRAPWNPPNYVFPIAWSILYLLIAIVGWRVFNTDDQQNKILWLAQLAANAAWSWLFFGQHWVGIAFIEILLLKALVAYLMHRCFESGDKLSGWLLVPYVLWLALATSLNGYILVYN